MQPTHETIKRLSSRETLCILYCVAQLAAETAALLQGFWRC